MELDYNCTGADRKNLVAVLADHTGQKAKAIPHRKKVPDTTKCDIINLWINR